MLKRYSQPFQSLLGLACDPSDRVPLSNGSLRSKVRGHKRLGRWQPREGEGRKGRRSILPTFCLPLPASLPADPFSNVAAGWTNGSVAWLLCG